ncbi:MAG: NAD-dependent epimerase/dehydratase family protein [Saprospirales bacterium]|nr:NAD-dependent epimerase/dehydratase family protein [Saprospirales bacterium]MBK8921910.1 NAD-dependent epimerase/dehydratase family protein [Saprospirales bacterium]
MTIALTGASGRIGNVLVRRLLEAGHQLRILQRRDSPALAGLPLQRVQGDLLDPAALSDLARGSEVLVHLAALISIHGARHGRVWQVNVDGTKKVLEACLRQGVRRVVCFSSVHAFSDFPLDGAFDETRPLALDSRMAYQRSKAEALALAMRFAAGRGLEVLALCPTSVIGPGDYGPSLSGQMLIDFYRRKIPLLVPGGFDWVDVRDVAQAAEAALTRGRNGEAYLLSGVYARMPEFARLVETVTGKAVPKYVAPNGLIRLGLPFVAVYARLTGTRPLYTGEALDALQYGSNRISSEKARRELGFSARPLEETVADSYTWFRQNNYL